MKTIEFSSKGFKLRRCKGHSSSYISEWQKRFYFVPSRQRHEGFCNRKRCALTEKELAAIFLYFEIKKIEFTSNIYYNLIL